MEWVGPASGVPISGTVPGHEAAGRDRTTGRQSILMRAAEAEAPSPCCRLAGYHASGAGSPQPDPAGRYGGSHVGPRRKLLLVDGHAATWACLGERSAAGLAAGVLGSPGGPGGQSGQWTVLVRAASGL